MAFNIGFYAYAIIGHTRADQLLPQLTMEHFDTCPIQCRYIEHMHMLFCLLFDENPAMTLRVIKETKRYRRTHGRTDNVKTVHPLQTKFAGGIIIFDKMTAVRTETIFP